MEVTENEARIIYIKEGTKTIGPKPEPIVFYPEINLYPVIEFILVEYLGKYKNERIVHKINDDNLMRVYGIDKILFALKYVQTERVKSLLFENPDYINIVYSENEEKYNLLEFFLASHKVYDYRYNIKHYIDITIILLQSSKDPKSLISERLKFYVEKNMVDINEILGRYTEIINSNKIYEINTNIDKEIDYAEIDKIIDAL